MTTRTYFTPRGFLYGEAAVSGTVSAVAWPLPTAQGRISFISVERTLVEDAEIRNEVFSRAQVEDDKTDHGLARAMDPLLRAIQKAPRTYGGKDLSCPILMGIVNVTPDSFSDGGHYSDPGSAILHARALLDAGADIVDVGGESTRPGAAPVAPDEEINRVIPVIKDLANAGACVSIDTRHALVMEAAVAAGARIINDVTALSGEPESLKTAAKAKVPVILMHMQGEPQTMQHNPTYVWAPGDVFDYLQGRISACMEAGIPQELIAVDPGIGFGKSVQHNAQIMNHLALLHGLGCPIVFGASRKSFIGRMSQGEPADQRLPGSLAAALNAVSQGAQILRVHEAAETRQALGISKNITESES